MPAHFEFFPDRESWLKARQGSLGASDIARVFTERVDPITLWAEKTGKQEPEFPPLLAEFGHAVETVSRAWKFGEGESKGGYRLLWPCRLIGAGGFRLYQNEEVPFAHHSPDTLLLDDSSFRLGMEWPPSRFAEHKSIDRLMSWKVQNGPEGYAWIQTQVGMAIMGIPALITYLVGNGFDADQDFRVFEVEPDQDWQEKLLGWAKDFWDKHVIPDVPPKPEGVEGYKRTLHLLLPTEKPRRSGILPSDYLVAARRLAIIKAAKDELIREEDKLKAEIDFAMGQAGLDEATIAVENPGERAPRFIRYQNPAREQVVKVSAHTVCKRLS